MSQTRLKSLLEMLQDEPNDAFLKYAIALEYKKVDIEKAIFFFDDLVEKNPEYIGTYYQFGIVLQEKNELQKAEYIFKKGIEIATKKPDFHALAELRSALNKLLGLDYEDD
ncbi:MAG: tetratricopeptide repeat protein [Bacteroidetes bacterium]|nr:MAG: tetratricopeptide repeat protein [Bacteroidota bacterium]